MMKSAKAGSRTLVAVVAYMTALFALVPLALIRDAMADTFVVDGVPRNYEIFVPSSASLPAPAMVLLHGGGGTADQLRDHLDFDDLAAANGIVAIYPDSSDRMWNDGRVSPALADQQGCGGGDDVRSSRLWSTPWSPTV